MTEPAASSSDRPYDVVLLGATGFTGALTASELAARAPAGARWAIAGRSAAKLAEVRERLAEEHPAAADLPLLEADVTDPASVRRLAGQTRVVITTVGPYVRLGEPLVAACAAAGTDYVDLTGEPEFVDRMWLEHHEQAVATGARIVHTCGFDSIPYDLGAQFCVEQLPRASRCRSRATCAPVASPRAAPSTPR
jgi:saccharopine dehydrogenase (NAD+, L-glutamate forming)